MQTNVNKPAIEESWSTILVAEDDADDRELIVDAFTSIDTSLILHTVPDGNSALIYLNNLSKDNLPCLIVLDYNMPDLNGAEVLKHLGANERFTKIPKVMLSTSNASHYVTECFKYGANDYLVKPSSFKELVTIAQQLLDMCRKGEV
jgi:CheY-like chemotaxis protein